MTATVVETVVETTTGDGDELVHITCHCSKHETSWCGLRDDSEYDPTPIGDDPNACSLCMLVLEECEAKEQCPWGCACAAECNPIIDEENPDDGCFAQWQRQFIELVWGPRFLGW